MGWTPNLADRAERPPVIAATNPVNRDAFFKRTQMSFRGISFSRMEPMVLHYIMAGHAVVVVKDITLLFCHGNAVILTLC